MKICRKSELVAACAYKIQNLCLGKFTVLLNVALGLGANIYCTN